jgi:hypothetical protein
LGTANRELCEPVLCDLEVGTCLTHLPPQIGQLRHRQPSVLGDDNNSRAAEDLVERGDHLLFL